MHKYGFRDWESVLAAIGHGGLKEGQVFNKLVEAYDKENKKNLTDEQVLEAAGETQEKLHITKNKSGIVVKGIHDVAVRFSKCCNPIPGDEIVGFVTRGRGITIHRTDCINVLNMSEMDQYTSDRGGMAAAGYDNRLRNTWRRSRFMPTTEQVFLWTCPRSLQNVR